MCVHKNVYAYISSKRVQQYVYIYTCVVLSALFLCADDVILLEKKKDYPIIVSLDGRREEDISQPLNTSKREKRGKDSTRIFFLDACMLHLPLRPKTLFISQFFFFVFFLLVKTFLRVCGCAKRKREREKRSRRERTQILSHTHTRLYNKRPSCKKERESIVCVYCARVVDIQEE